MQVFSASVARQAVICIVMLWMSSVSALGFSEERQQSFLLGKCLGGMCGIIRTDLDLRRWRSRKLQEVKPSKPSELKPVMHKIFPRHEFRSCVLLATFWSGANAIAHEMFMIRELDAVRPSWFLIGLWLGAVLCSNFESCFFRGDFWRVSSLLKEPAHVDGVQYKEKQGDSKKQVLFVLICSSIVLFALPHIPDAGHQASVEMKATKIWKKI